MTLAIRAKVAPLPEPSAAAIARNATVPMPCSGGVPAEIAGTDDHDAEAGGEHRDRAELVGEPATDRTHDHRDDARTRPSGWPRRPG